MHVNRLLSNRSSEQWPSWHIVHEWEDEISRGLNIPLDTYTFSRGKLEKLFTNRFAYKLLTPEKLDRILQLLDQLENKPDKYLIYEMVVLDSFRDNITTKSNAVPIIIDLWLGKTEIDRFYKTYRNNPLVIISGIAAYQMLLNDGCPLNIYNLPVSIPDKYALKQEILFEKKYDIIFAGRKNKVLWEYLQALSCKFPEIEYIYQEREQEHLYYTSNKRGRLGMFLQRHEYIDLLRASRIGIYSTPGVDEGAARTKGSDTVTPRYLEYMAAQCFVISRHTDHADSRFFEMEKICPHVETYEDFERQVIQHLNAEHFPFQTYMEVLNKHYTSKRIPLLKDILSGT
jgi:hypothetical protein